MLAPPNFRMPADRSVNIVCPCLIAHAGRSEDGRRDRHVGQKTLQVHGCHDAEGTTFSSDLSVVIVPQTDQASDP